MQFDNLRILIIEDTPSDFVLAKIHLERNFTNPSILHCEDLHSFKDAVTTQDFDLIISDFELRGENGLEALLFAVTQDIEIPYIFLTGALNNEEKAAETILQGADGYVLKDNLSGLTNKVKQVLQKKAKEQEEKRKVKAQIDMAIDHMKVDKAELVMDRLVEQFDKVQSILETLQKNL